MRIKWKLPRFTISFKFPVLIGQNEIGNSDMQALNVEYSVMEWYKPLSSQRESCQVDSASILWFLIGA